MSKTIYKTKVFKKIENEIFVHTQKIYIDVYVHMVIGFIFFNWFQIFDNYCIIGIWKVFELI